MESTDRSCQLAYTEASRCLYCVDPPCVKGCPVEIDIPGFIRLIRWKDIKGAKEIIKKSNCLGTLCSYLCPSEELCEKDCVRSRIDSGIKIAELQRFACNYPYHYSGVDAAKEIHKRVAVIGGGPAGISCAVQLSALGYEVEIFEKEKFIAGTVAKEIPEFKIPRGVVEKEISELGIDQIKVHFGVRVDRELLKNEISKQYDAAFIGIGLHESRKGELDTKKLKHVYEASDFLSSVKTGVFKQIKGTCVTVGGGDTAIDCARTALRLGAKRSMIAYRRSKNEMPAAAAEFMQAGKEGVEFLWQVLPIRLLGKGKVAEIEFVITELVSSKSGNRKGFREIRNANVRFPADVVVLALGKDRDGEIASFLDLRKMTLNLDTLQIGNTKYFSGGDFVNGGKTVIEAVAHGKKAALSIDRYLKSF
jgi:NADPH-dependent glutamate synthase beta subunit-like oxidoreductase